MIGILPKSLEVNGKDYPIRSDFRVALLIFEAYDDADLSDYERAEICLQCLYEKPQFIPSADMREALEKAIWFLDGGDMPKSKAFGRKMLDWAQDESIIFPAVNKVAGYETRMAEYLHWWSFLGLFNEIGEGLFSTVMSIRSKKAKGKKLDKWEQDFCRDHREMVEIKIRYSEKEQQEMDRINKLLG